ncbi:MAG: 50S ribosomal protein L2 [Thermoplasmata archaeon]
MGKRIIPQRRGRGSSIYRSPSHRHLAKPGYPKSQDARGEVIELHHSPGRTAPLAEIEFDNGETCFMLANYGLREGQQIDLGPNAPPKRSNVLPLRRIPVGTFVHNIEIEPLDGGKLVRSSGTYATIVSHGKKMTTIRMPSGAFKRIDSRSRATIGIVAGGGHKDKPFAKAGKRVHAYKSNAKDSVKVRGIAMNAVSHPHGGGDHQHVGVPSTVSAHAPPGRKVGRISSKKTRKKKKKEARDKKR